MSKWVVWSSVTHGGCWFWKINPASIQPTTHISPSALQTSGHPPWVILLQLLKRSRSAVLSFYSESVRLGLRKKNLRWLETKGAEIPSGPWPYKQRYRINIEWAWNYYSVEYCSMHCFHCESSIRTLSAANHISLLQHTWPYLTSKCWINRRFPSVFYLSYICDLQPNTLFVYLTALKSSRFSFCRLCKQGAIEASHVWNQQRLKHKGELQWRKAGK